MCGSTSRNSTSLPLAFTAIIRNRQRWGAKLGICFRWADISATSVPSCIYENLPAVPRITWAWNSWVPASQNFWHDWCHSEVLLQKRGKDSASIEQVSKTPSLLSVLLVAYLKCAQWCIWETWKQFITSFFYFLGTPSPVYVFWKILQFCTQNLQFKLRLLPSHW